MDISIIVITFNSAHCIEQCVSDAQQALAGAKLSGEIIVFENGSTDGTTQKLQRLEGQHENLKVIYSPYNTGTTTSRNAAMKESVGDYILVLDSDAFLTADCIAELRTYLIQNPEFGLVGPKLTYASGNFQLSYDDFPTVQRKLERALFLKNIEKRPLPGAQAMEVDYLISAYWLFTREVYETVGPLDENIFYAPEDVDFCIRVWKAGFKIGYVPSYQMVHDAQELSRGFVINKFKFLHLKGLAYYFRKHGYAFNIKGVRQQIKDAVSARMDKLQSTPGA